MKRKFWTTDAFKNLSKIWDHRLSQSGFTDIEKSIGSTRVLKQKANHCYCWTADPTTRFAKERYFQLISQYSQTEYFQDKVERLVLQRRSQGHSIKSICVELKQLNERHYRNTISNIIKKYEIRWGMREVSILRFHGGQLPQRYLNFILAKWTRSYRLGNDYIKLIDQNSYFQNYSLYIQKILSKPSTTIRIAALSDDHDIALGFSVMENLTLHYCFVSKDYRKLGFAKLLSPVPIDTFTHLTNTGIAIWSKYKDLKFDPFKL